MFDSVTIIFVCFYAVEVYFADTTINNTIKEMEARLSVVENITTLQDDRMNTPKNLEGCS